MSLPREHLSLPLWWNWLRLLGWGGGNAAAICHLLDGALDWAQHPQPPPKLCAVRMLSETEQLPHRSRVVFFTGVSWTPPVIYKFVGGDPQGQRYLVVVSLALGQEYLRVTRRKGWGRNNREMRFFLDWIQPGFSIPSVSGLITISRLLCKERKEWRGGQPWASMLTWKYLPQPHSTHSTS